MGIILADGGVARQVSTLPIYRRTSDGKIINFVTTRTPYIVGTKHLPRKLIYRFFQGIWPERYYGLSLGFFACLLLFVCFLINGHIATQHQPIWNIIQESFAGLLVSEFSRGFWLKFLLFVVAIWQISVAFVALSFGPCTTGKQLFFINTAVICVGCKLSFQGPLSTWSLHSYLIFNFGAAVLRAFI